MLFLVPARRAHSALRPKVGPKGRKELSRHQDKNDSPNNFARPSQLQQRGASTAKMVPQYAWPFSAGNNESCTMRSQLLVGGLYCEYALRRGTHATHTWLKRYGRRRLADPSV